MTEISGTVPDLYCPECSLPFERVEVLDGLSRCDWCKAGITLIARTSVTGPVRKVPGEGVRRSSAYPDLEVLDEVLEH